MSSQKQWKLLGAIIVAVALLGGVVGWQQFAPKPTPPTTITVTPAATTVTGSQTIVVPVRQTEWIQVGQVKPINYYLSLLEANGTQPYVQLAKELRKLPDLTNATAVAKITYLALNSTNPEVKEAFELMMKGGTPDPKDFKYTVPSWNTELQVLYWLACQSEFKKDDTLALATAIVNGLWVSIGDQQVKDSVMRDTSNLLAFFREANQLQTTRGYYQLENYPLEAKFCLAWTANHAPIVQPTNIRPYTEHPLSMKAYERITVSVSTLKKMQKHIDLKGWGQRNCTAVLFALERFFFFTERRGPYSKNWEYITPEKEAMIDYYGGQIPNHHIMDPDFLYEYYLQNGKGIGGCSDEAALVDAFCKSYGISTTCLVNEIYLGDNQWLGHACVTCYDPAIEKWVAYPEQGWIIESDLANNPSNQCCFYVIKQAWCQESYVKPWGGYWYKAFVFASTSGRQVVRQFVNGVPSSQMKRWLLYS
jgi:hypothetical protein